MQSPKSEGAKLQRQSRPGCLRESSPSTQKARGAPRRSGNTGAVAKGSCFPSSLRSSSSRLRREVCKDANRPEPTFVRALRSRRFSRRPVCSDLPSTEPLTAHLLNRVLRILSAKRGRGENPAVGVSSFHNRAKPATSPRTHAAPREALSGRAKDGARPRRAHLRPRQHGPGVRWLPVTSVPRSVACHVLEERYSGAPRQKCFPLSRRGNRRRTEMGTGGAPSPSTFQSPCRSLPIY